MRLTLSPSLALPLLVAVVLAVLVVGCAVPSPVVPVPGSAAGNNLDPNGHNAASPTPNPDDPNGPLTRAAADQADALNVAMRQGSAAANVPPPEVRWIDASGSSSGDAAIVPASNPAQPSLLSALADMAKQASSSSATTANSNPTQAANAALAANGLVSGASGGSGGDLSHPSREQLLNTLFKTIYVSDSPELAKAVDAATLAALDPKRGDLNPAFLTHLSFEQIEQVRRYHQVVALLAQAVSVNSDSDALGRDAVLAQFNSLFGEQPLAIRKLLLCKRVRGYGAYEAFPDTTFLAGRDQRAILYVELDQFRSIADGNGQYETKLAQEVVLYNESDGLAVWKQTPVDIIDHCANPRRDFFIVQLVTLPARLTVGKYLLKVRVTDLHGGSMDEVTQPIQIVADQGLVQLDAAK
jgi:hypothetical protein